MPSARDTKNGPDWKDLASVMESLEADQEAVVTIGLALRRWENHLGFTMTALLTAAVPVVLDPPVLASASVSFPGNGATDFEAALLSLLYALDHELARQMLDS